MRATVLLVVSLAASGCAREGEVFSVRNARAHVEMLAGTIGSRPPGTEAHARARAYVIDQLRMYGYQVRVQETDARRPEFGRTAHVANIIGVLPGTRPEAIGLLSHYDSRGDTPGAGDDAFGVAVSLEAARLAAARPERQWTTYVLVTDAEELGLMGAAALMTDTDVRDRLAAYVNVESTGSGPPVVLFETGPANDWLVGLWAKHAPRPRGGSYAIEIYTRLPNDTDFSILKRHDIPGLNFAAIGDSYTYHTARDTPERLSDGALRDAGENVVAVVDALQRSDVTARSPRQATYFDIGATVAVSYAAVVTWISSTMALVLGALAWFRITRHLVVQEGLGRWLVGLVWMVLAAVVTVAAMIVATAALRAAREAYHPWYARPDRLFLLLTAVGGGAAWMMARAGRWIPARSKGVRHPAVAWTYALPVWIALALLMLWGAPAAAYLWTGPLFAAGLLLLVTPPSRGGMLRVVSLVILGVSATFWLRDAVDVLRFLVAMFGRMPFVTPVYVYAVVIAVVGLMIVPPLFAATAAPVPLLRPALPTALFLAAIAGTLLAAWLAPAYTPDRPLRRYVRAVQEAGADRSVWKVGSLEPGLDLGPDGPSNWMPGEPRIDGVPWVPLGQPFVFWSFGEPLGAAPASISRFAASAAPDGRGTVLDLSVVPREPALAVSFILPAGVEPARSSLPGVTRLGRWTATFHSPPPEGIAWQASFAAPPDLVRGVRVAITASGLPGAPGWQRLPPWLPQEAMVWSGAFTWILDPAAAAPLEPAPPLR